MEFDEIVVKESPGLCRCCLSEGCYKDMGTEYTWMNENEVYADMLLECFDIGISQHNDGPNGPNRLICEVCITRLRDACNFKKQVLDSEKKFVDMVGRGEFRPKVLIYQSQMKSEANEETAGEDAEVEYLEEIDFGDDDEPLKNEPSASEIAVEPLPVSKRGRPRKTLKAEKKKPKVDERPKTSKALVKGLKEKISRENRLQRLCRVRSNILAVLRYGNVMPFKWHTKAFTCFYCAKPFKDCLTVKEHTHTKHNSVDLESFIPKIVSKDVPVKVDVTWIACKFCPEVLIRTIDELIAHVVSVHEEDYDYTAGVCLLPFVLDKDVMACVICEKQFDNFSSMMTHMNKEHIAHSHICQICGLSFINMIRLNRHINTSHVGFRCTLCNKVCETYNKLEVHKSRMHGRVKTHYCSLCSASFESSYQMKVHMGKVHNVEKYRIQCEHCPKICTTKGAMVLHVKSLHSDLRYECDMCEYKTAIKWMIKLHKRKHFGERSYACSICERKFGRSSNLRAHLKVHTGQIGRVCRHCRRGFTDQTTLENHKTEVHYFDQE